MQRMWCAGERRVTVVRSPKSGVNFFSLGDFEEQLEMACQRAQPAIYQVRQACSGMPELGLSWQGSAEPAVTAQPTCAESEDGAATQGQGYHIAAGETV